MTWSLRFSDEVPRVAVLVSKQHHCMYDILARWRMGELHADIPLVISNHDDGRAIAEEFGVAYHHLPVAAGDEGGAGSADRRRCSRRSASTS